MKTIAIITGVTGQDGSYLSELLLQKEYIIFGIVRRASTINTSRIDHIYNHASFFLEYGDVTDLNSLSRIFSKVKSLYPNMNRLEVYNLAAMSHVKVSFDMPIYSAHANGLGTLHLLDCIREHGLEQVARFYQASTSELYGNVQEIPQTETTPFYPRSPYGVAKLYSFWITKNYRESYSMFCSNGILFNHESPRRGETFVTRKITKAVGKICRGEQKELLLGNLDSKRDWGHAKDYVEGMWKILQYEKADDFILSTNQYHTVREFVETAFSCKNIIIKWKGKGLDEIGIHEATGKVLIRIDPKYFRPAEVNELLGDYSKAKQKLNWKPAIGFLELVQEMVNYDS